MNIPGPVLLPMITVAIALLVLGMIGARSVDAGTAVRAHLLLALGTFVAVVVASFAVHAALPGLFGLPIVVGPGIAAAAGIAAFGALPFRGVPSKGARVASLRVRTAREVVGGRTLVGPVAALGVLVAVLVATGLTADRAGYSTGRAVSAQHGDLGASASPYPGAYYGMPVMIACALLLLSMTIAVRRTVLLPAVSRDPAVDGPWRRAVGEALASIATAGILLYLGGVLGAASDGWKVLGQVGAPRLIPAAVLETAQSVLGRVTVLGALILLAITTVRVAHVGRTVAATSAPT